MQTLIKLLIALAILLICAQIDKRRPELTGLIAVMPLTGLLALLWLYSDNAGDSIIMKRYAIGAVWGIVPSILFFAAVYLGFQRQWHLALVLALGFSVWLAAALVHQYVLRAKPPNETLTSAPTPDKIRPPKFNLFSPRTSMKMKLTFLGAVQNVTGSRFLLEANGAKLLIDCGIYQERQMRDRNWNPCYVDPAQIDAVLITHAHLDHCGWLPKLVKDGFHGQVFCTTATAEIARIVLLDSAKIQMEDAACKQKRHKKEGRTSPFPYQPLYNLEDAEATLPLFTPVAYDKTVAIADGIEADFHDAGHILGASMIKLAVHNRNQKRTILFSGDIGRWDKPILRDPTVFDQADYVLIESTYGDRIHEDNHDIAAELADVINTTHQAGGNIIIPSFSIERAQDLLYHLNDLLHAKRIPPLMAFLDSPMAIRVTEVFKNHPEMFDKDMKEMIRRDRSPFDFPHLTMTRTTNGSKAINFITGTIIVIAGSGMCTGGRIKHHLVNNISRPECTILFVGYQARGTLGRTILDQPEQVRIHGQKRAINARIARLHGFSGHADQTELIRWLQHLKKPPKNIFVVHGESEPAHALAHIGKQKLNFPFTIPQYRQQITLD